jgi:hypothetical protein
MQLMLLCLLSLCCLPPLLLREAVALRRQRWSSERGGLRQLQQLLRLPLLHLLLRLLLLRLRQHQQQPLQALQLSAVAGSC